jgi:hypothetical protein
MDKGWRRIRPVGSLKTFWTEASMALKEAIDLEIVDP